MFYLFQSHTEANCTVSFRLNGQDVQGCVHKPTPSAKNEKCARVREKAGVKFSDDVDEFVVLSAEGEDGKNKKSRKVVTKCFREEPGRSVYLPCMMTFNIYCSEGAIPCVTPMNMLVRYSLCSLFPLPLG